VQQSVAQALGFAARELAVQREGLGIEEEFLGDEDELEPHGVGDKVAEGQVLKAAVLGGADAVLDAGAGAMETFQGGDVLAVLVGKDRLEAVAVVVGEGELRAGVWRSRRTITRVSGGQAVRSSRSVISATCPLSRGRPSWSSAGTQAFSGRARIAARTG